MKPKRCLCRAIVLLTIALSATAGAQQHQKTENDAGPIAVVELAKKFCGGDDKKSISERINECDEKRIVSSTGQYFSLVARVANGKGDVVEYFADEFSKPKLVWGPLMVQSKMGVSTAYALPEGKDAQPLCQGLKNLGLSWDLPSREDFLKAGNNANKSSESNKNILEAFPELNRRAFWTSTPGSESYYLTKFFGQIAAFRDSDRRTHGEALCVSAFESSTQPTKIKKLSAEELQVALSTANAKDFERILNDQNVAINERIGTHASAPYPLTLAAQKSGGQFTQLLLSRGAKVDVMAGELSSQSPLLLAAEAGNTEALKLLLKAGANVKLKDFRGDTALLRVLKAPIYSSSNFNLETASTLLMHGVPVNEKDSHGVDAFRLAVMQPKVPQEFIEQMLKKGVELNRYKIGGEFKNNFSDPFDYLYQVMTTDKNLAKSMGHSEESLRQEEDRVLKIVDVLDTYSKENLEIKKLVAEAALVRQNRKP